MGHRGCPPRTSNTADTVEIGDHRIGTLRNPVVRGRQIEQRGSAGSRSFGVERRRAGKSPKRLKPNTVQARIREGPGKIGDPGGRRGVFPRRRPGAKPCPRCEPVIATALTQKGPSFFRGNGFVGRHIDFSFIFRQTKRLWPLFGSLLVFAGLWNSAGRNLRFLAINFSRNSRFRPNFNFPVRLARIPGWPATGICPGNGFVNWAVPLSWPRGANRENSQFKRGKKPGIQPIKVRGQRSRSLGSRGVTQRSRRKG